MGISPKDITFDVNLDICSQFSNNDGRMYKGDSNYAVKCKIHSGNERI